MTSTRSRGGASRPKKAEAGKSRKARKPKRPAAKRKPRASTTKLTWDGVTMTVTYEPESFAHHAHLQIQVTAPERTAPLPITETGYRSHFLPRGDVEAAGGPAAYVRRWLDEAARSPAWPRRRFRWRQLELF